MTRTCAALRYGDYGGSGGSRGGDYHGEGRGRGGPPPAGRGSYQFSDGDWPCPNPGSVLHLLRLCVHACFDQCASVCLLWGLDGQGTCVPSWLFRVLLFLP
jgi:hypothetical protein